MVRAISCGRFKWKANHLTQTTLLLIDIFLSLSIENFTSYNHCLKRSAQHHLMTARSATGPTLRVIERRMYSNYRI